MPTSSSEPKPLKQRVFAGLAEDPRDSRNIQMARERAYVLATREVDVTEGIVYFEEWAERVRAHGKGFKWPAKLLEQRWLSHAGGEIRTRMVTEFGAARTEMRRGRQCVQGYVMVRADVAKRKQLRERVDSGRAYFDE